MALSQLIVTRMPVLGAKKTHNANGGSYRHSYIVSTETVTSVPLPLWLLREKLPPKALARS
jgi:hypothetical protein